MHDDKVGTKEPKVTKKPRRTKRDIEFLKFRARLFSDESLSAPMRREIAFVTA